MEKKVIEKYFLKDDDLSYVAMTDDGSRIDANVVVGNQQVYLTSMGKNYDNVKDFLEKVLSGRDTHTYESMKKEERDRRLPDEDSFETVQPTTETDGQDPCVDGVPGGEATETTGSEVHSTATSDGHQPG